MRDRNFLKIKLCGAVRKSRRTVYGEMFGVMPLGASKVLDEGAKPPPAGTLPAPGSSGVTIADPVVAKRPADAEYGGALAIVAEVVVVVVES